VIDGGGRPIGTRPALELAHARQGAVAENVGRNGSDCQSTATKTSGRRGCDPDCPVGHKEPVNAP